MDRRGLVRPVPTDTAGVRGPTPGQARGPDFRRTSRGLYVAASVGGDRPEQRILEAAAAVPDGAVTGWAALRWLGGTWFGGLNASGAPRRVTVLCRHKHLDQPGLRISQEGWCPESDLLEVDDVRVTVPSRAVYYEMRFAPTLIDAVVALDMACYSDLVTVEEVAETVQTHGPRTGVGQARLAVQLGDENSWSPQETATRLLWEVRAGLPRLSCNQPVFDSGGRLIGTPDLLDVEAGVALDYDGAVHLHAPQRRKDRDREHRFRSVGLDLLPVMAGDLTREHTVQLMRGVRARAASTPVELRRWTVDAPPWWTPTDTVEARRALDIAGRDRLLRYRRAG